MRSFTRAALLVSAMVASATHAFNVSPTAGPAAHHRRASVALHAAFEQQQAEVEATTTVGESSVGLGPVAALALLAAAALSAAAAPAMAVSGGGLDYAGTDLSGQDFSNGNYKGKDFTQVLAKATNFAKSNLQGCRFYRAYLVNADFTGSDIRGAALEDTSMDGASLKNVLAAGAYFGQSLVDVETLENGDFTDATVPPKTLALVCERDDVKGTNPVTGVDTRESLMCL